MGSQAMAVKLILVVLLVAVLVILIVSLYNWEEPLYAGVPYPQWGHWVGWILVGLSACQVPLWAGLMFLVYACKRKVKQVVTPTPLWGPGDPEVRKAIFEEINGIAPRKPVPYGGYDN